VGVSDDPEADRIRSAKPLANPSVEPTKTSADLNYRPNQAELEPNGLTNRTFGKENELCELGKTTNRSMHS
jgi:hypothetical protein